MERLENRQLLAAAAGVVPIAGLALPSEVLGTGEVAEGVNVGSSLEQTSPHTATIKLHRDDYPIGPRTSIIVQITDPDLIGRGRVDVEFRTSSGDRKVAPASPLTGQPDRFQASIATGVGPIIDNDFVLQVQDGDVIIATYVDPLDENGNERVIEARATAIGSSAIGGHTFDDLNRDGIHDRDEPSLAGLTVYLDQNENGTRDTDELTTVTDATGNYQFTRLMPGRYSVRQELPDDRQQTSPAVPAHTIDLDLEQTVTELDFGSTLEATPPPPPSLPGVSIRDARPVREGGPAFFVVTLSEPSTEPVTVSFSAETGTATAGEDFRTPILTSLTFGPGQVSRLIVVPTLTDSLDELTEDFRVLLTTADGATIEDGEATGTILNVTPPPPPTEELVDVTVTVTDLDGDRLDEIQLGQQFRIDVYAQDLRSIARASPRCTPMSSLTPRWWM
jgi:hypothetical protein